MYVILLATPYCSTKKSEKMVSIIQSRHNIYTNGCLRNSMLVGVTLLQTSIPFWSLHCPSCSMCAIRLACITYQRQTSQEQEEQSFPGEEICHSVGHEAQGSH